ncbi:MAG TPA: DUF3084 domain-containing protein [Candidatus Baltobacteraceae bacterium]|jgi:hypothetical protein|nr:DUF3084 domain-containing protein [Candidatus Baltobacteraceae bacterium]
MEYLGGILSIILITAIAGGIAYVGDRVGHQVGRLRLSLFGLRPRHTSTIFAIGTGMMIAFVVSVTALATSTYVRTAFFHLGELQAHINDLEAQRNQLEKKTKKGNVVINIGQSLSSGFLVLTPDETNAVRLKNFETYFDAVVKTLNQTYVPMGLKAYPLKSSDPQNREKLQAYLSQPEIQGLLIQEPLIILPVASENLFPTDAIHFAFKYWPDHRIFRDHEVIAQVMVDGGSTISTNFAFSRLLTIAEEVASNAGMPSYFAQAVPLLHPGDSQNIANRIRSGKGKFAILVEAAEEIYPHVGGLPVIFVLKQISK